MKRTKSRFKALVLDKDGVLIDTEPYQFQAFRQTFKSLGIDIPDPYLFRLVGDPLQQNLSDISDDPIDGLDHEMHVQRRRNAMRSQCLGHVWPHGQIRHVVVIHDVEMDHILSGIEDRLDLFA